MNREERVYSVTMTENELKLFSEFLEQKVFENQKGNDILNEWTPDYTGDLKQPWLSDGVEGVKKSRADRNKYQDKYQKSIDKAIQIAKKEGLYKDSPNEKFEHIFNGFQPGKTHDDFNPRSDADSRDEAEANIAREYRAYRSRTGHYHPLNRTDEVINTDRFIYYNSDGRSYDRNLTDFAEEVKSNLPLSPKEKERLVKEVLNPVKKYDPKTDKPLVEIDEDVPIITEPEEEDNDTLALADQVRFNEEQKKKLSGNENTGKKYDPKTDKPLVEIDEDVPIITEPEEKERTEELNKFQRDRKREEFINKMKEVPGKIKNKYDSLSDKYSENFDGRSLGKDAAIAAGATAALSAGAYGLHKYLKKKKASKKKAEDKFKK